MKRAKQTERIKAYIDRFGSITHREAVYELGILGFTARMTELRQEGVLFYEANETSRNRLGEPCTYKRYFTDSYLFNAYNQANENRVHNSDSTRN